MDLSIAQSEVLLALGVRPGDVGPFERGEVVSFGYPTAGGEPLEGFVYLDPARWPHPSGLVSQVLFVSNPLPWAAFRAMLQFRDRSIAVARALGLQQVELQAGTVINPAVRTMLIRRGFQLRTVQAPANLGGGPQEVFSLQVRIP